MQSYVTLDVHQQLPGYSLNTSEDTLTKILDIIGLENVRASTSHSRIGFHCLLEG
jgi:hypothetical protein